jgi:hypothetical protein
VQGLQSEAVSDPGSGRPRCQHLPKGGNQNYLLAVRKGNYGSFPPDAGSSGVLPRVLPAAAKHEFTGVNTREGLAVISHTAFDGGRQVIFCVVSSLIQTVNSNSFSNLVIFGSTATPGCVGLPLTLVRALPSICENHTARSGRATFGPI